MFSYGSGSSDPYHGITDPDPALSSVTFKNKAFLPGFFSYYLSKLHFNQSSKVTSYLYLLSSRKTIEIKVFLYFFIIDGTYSFKRTT